MSSWWKLILIVLCSALSAPLHYGCATRSRPAQSAKEDPSKKNKTSAKKKPKKPLPPPPPLSY